MIGNDIIDLAFSKTESKWNRSGFIEKIFTEREQFLIAQSKNTELVIWKLWSIKEAAYKIWNRQTGNRLFNPKFFECAFADDESGQLTIGHKTYFSKSCITAHYIHSIVVEYKSDFRKVVVLKNRSKILKLGTLPYFIENNGFQNPNVSISNHGKFEKVVFLKS